MVVWEGKTSTIFHLENGSFQLPNLPNQYISEQSEFICLRGAPLDIQGAMEVWVGQIFLLSSKAAKVFFYISMYFLQLS